jgi:hypothetical protein
MAVPQEIFIVYDTKAKTVRGVFGTRELADAFVRRGVSDSGGSFAADDVWVYRWFLNAPIDVGHSGDNVVGARKTEKKKKRGRVCDMCQDTDGTPLYGQVGRYYACEDTYIDCPGCTGDAKRR